MMPFLDAVGLWVFYTLTGAVCVIIYLLMVCLPIAAVYAAVHVLAKLIALILRRRPRQGGMR